MKFIKTVDLWDNNIIASIESGDLVLQVGQWVSCGSGKKSRFISYEDGVFNVVHYPATTKKLSVRAKLHALSKDGSLSYSDRRKKLMEIIK